MKKILLGIITVLSLGMIGYSGGIVYNSVKGNIDKNSLEKDIKKLDDTIKEGGGLQIHIKSNGRRGDIGGIRLGRLSRLGRLRAALRRGAGPHVAGQGLRCQRRVQRGGADAFERGVHAPAARGLRAGIRCVICLVFDSGLR